MENSKCCETCEHYAEYKGSMQCWNRDSDYMYQNTAPDFRCIEYDRKENDKNDMRHNGSS